MKAILALLLAVFLLGAAATAGYVIYRQRGGDRDIPAAVAANQSGQVGVQEIMPNPKTDLDMEVAASTADPEMLKNLMYEISKNTDTVGWLNLPDTTINNSVVQSHNNSYYLRRDERRQDSVYGCYFADYECSVSSRENLLPNTVIYGHSDLKDNPEGPRFSQLFKYTDPEFADSHRVIYLTVPEETQEWEIFATFYTDISFDYIRVNLTEQVHREITDKAIGLSVFDYGVKPGTTDPLLTLSTCSVRDGNDGNHRFVVMARLKPEE